MTLLFANQISIRREKKIICQDLDLSIKTGSFWGILGPNGSGKTTLLQALAGIYPLTGGTLFLREHSIFHLPKKIIAQSIGILFQDFNEHVMQSVWDYCCASRFPHQSYFHRIGDQDKKWVLDNLKKMDLGAFAHKTIDQLSGGEKRRLSIASLLIQAPQIYLLDEPTNHLDIKYQIKVLKILKSLAQTGSVVAVLHDINHAQLFCDHLLLLYPDGNILQGRTNDILTEENLSALYEHKIKANKNMYWQPDIS